MTSTSLTTYDEKRAAAAAAYVEQIKPKTSNDFLKVGLDGFKAGDDLMGTEIAVCIINDIYMNTMYADKWQPGMKKPPVCYAYGHHGDVMAPHPSMQLHPELFYPQNDVCGVAKQPGCCPLNEWGSADTGQGKACQNRVKIALIIVGQYMPRPKSRDTDLELFDFTTEEGAHYFRNAAPMTLTLPPTSVDKFTAYVHGLAKLKQPPYGVATRMYVTSGAGKQPGGFTINFELIDTLPDDLFDMMQAQHVDLGADALATPFSPPKEEEAPAPKQKPVTNLVRR